MFSFVKVVRWHKNGKEYIWFPKQDLVAYILITLALCNIQHDNKEDFEYVCNRYINKFAIYINIII